jgi:DNA polymerase III delta prime subunit
VDTIIIFTCNSTEKLQKRFLSRCEVVEFSSYGIAKETAELLADVWSKETADASPVPNFARIVKEANNNVRESLQVLQKFVRRATRG